MIQPLSEPVFVTLCDDEGTGRIVVELDSFVRYARQLDAALAELEAKWSHLAPRPTPSLRCWDKAQELDP